MTPITSETSIREIVEKSQAMTDFFKQIGVDLERDGAATIDDVCGEEGLVTTMVIELLLRIDTPETVEVPDESHATLTQLADRIVAEHHGYLRRELPRLEMLIGRHGPQVSDHRLDQIRAVFLKLRIDLKKHMLAEEQVLFPLIQEISWAKRVPGSYGGGVGIHIVQSKRDHVRFDRAMSSLRRLTHRFTAPATAPVSYRSFVAGLAALEKNLRRYTHLEADVLFPRTLADETELKERRMGTCIDLLTAF